MLIILGSSTLKSYETVDPSVAHYITALDFRFHLFIKKKKNTVCMLLYQSITVINFSALSSFHVKLIDIVGSRGSTTGLGLIQKTYCSTRPS